LTVKKILPLRLGHETSSIIGFGGKARGETERSAMPGFLGQDRKLIKSSRNCTPKYLLNEQLKSKAEKGPKAT
jgi:hypothetical protein